MDQSVSQYIVTLCNHDAYRATDGDTICYISTANIPLVLRTRSICVRNKYLAVRSRASRYKQSEPKASGAKGFRTPYGVIAIDSQ